MNDRQAARAEAEDAQGFEMPVPKRKDLIADIRKLLRPVKKPER